MIVRFDKAGFLPAVGLALAGVAMMVTAGLIELVDRVGKAQEDET
jgi:hypothetical protein